MMNKQHLSVLFFPLMTSQNARYAAEAMMKAGILHSYHTKTALINGRLNMFLSKLPGLYILRRRFYNKNMSPYLVSYWFDELSIMFLEKLKLNRFFKSFCNQNNALVRLDQKVANFLCKHKDEITAVYGFEDTSAITFSKAREYGITCIYELPIGYWRAKEILMRNQCTLYPEWSCTLGFTDEPQEKLKRKDTELQLANHIFVPSQFVLDTLNEYPSYNKLGSIDIITYGGPDKCINHPIKKGTSKKLKILFCGGLTQRKGLADVFNVVERVSDIAELTVIGGGRINECTPLAENLKKHNYLGVINHEDVLEQMRHHDIMIFPSYFEGFALVIMEAMSQGLPIIVSNITSGPIKNGKDGWIVSPGNINSMVNLIRELSDNRKRINNCAIEAIKTAQTHTWAEYQKILIEIIYNRLCVQK